MIEGVKVKILTIHPSQDGDFREVFRSDEGLLDVIKQVSISRGLPGIIKAFHFHKHQDDLFYVLDGNILLGLSDQRTESPTFRENQRLLLGESYTPKIVLIPRGVFHGYRVLGDKPARVLYAMNNTYNQQNPDEGRVEFDDPKIGFDWNNISE